MNTLESLRDAIAQLQAYRFITPPPGKAIRQWFCPPMEEGMTVISRDAALAVIDALTAAMPQVDGEADEAVMAATLKALGAILVALGFDPEWENDQVVAAIHEMRRALSAQEQPARIPPKVDGEAISDAAVEAMYEALCEVTGGSLHEPEAIAEWQGQARRVLAKVAPHLSPLPPTSNEVAAASVEAGAAVGICTVVCSDFHQQGKYARIDAIEGSMSLPVGRHPVYTTPQPAAPALPDHQFRELVNDLRDTAKQFHATQQLRERIAGVVHRYLRPNGAAPAVEPIPMLLHCPKCGAQHVDDMDEGIAPGQTTGWDNPPHRSHLCHACGCIWRPADVATTGVARIRTTGKADNWTAAPVAAPAVDGWIVADSQEKRFRCWTESGPEWTTDRSKAHRSARREDAEALAAGDEDAWRIVPYSAAPQHATPTPMDEAIAAGDGTLHGAIDHWQQRALAAEAKVAAPAQAAGSEDNQTVEWYEARYWESIRDIESRSAASDGDGWKNLSRAVAALQMRAFGRGEIDFYHALQYVHCTFGKNRAAAPASPVATLNEHAGNSGGLADGRKWFAVLNPTRREGVVFLDRSEVGYASTGETSRPWFAGVSVIGDAFRDAYDYVDGDHPIIELIELAIQPAPPAGEQA